MARLHSIGRVLSRSVRHFHTAAFRLPKLISPAVGFSSAGRPPIHVARTQLPKDPLTQAALLPDPEAAKTALRAMPARRPEVSAIDGKFETSPIAFAHAFENSKAVLAFAKHQDAEGKTVLHRAPETPRGNALVYMVVSASIREKRDPFALFSIPDKHGDTAAHAALKSIQPSNLPGSYQLIALTDLSLRNQRGQTVMDCAMHSRDCLEFSNLAFYSAARLVFPATQLESPSAVYLETDQLLPSPYPTFTQCGDEQLRNSLKHWAKTSTHETNILQVSVDGNTYTLNASIPVAQTRGRSLIGMPHFDFMALPITTHAHNHPSKTFSPQSDSILGDILMDNKKLGANISHADIQQKIIQRRDLMLQFAACLPSLEDLALYARMNPTTRKLIFTEYNQLSITISPQFFEHFQDRAELLRIAMDTVRDIIYDIRSDVDTLEKATTHLSALAKPLGLDLTFTF